MQAGKALLAVFGATAAFAQSSPQPEASARPEFEVATIRPSAQALEVGVTAGVKIDGAQFRSAFLTLKDYLGLAYRVKVYQISGPDWISSERFDISATMTPGTAPQIPEMMQRLLEERFQIKIHREKKDSAVYVLEIAKGGLKLHESAPDPNAEDARAPLTITGGGNAQGVSVNLGRGSSYTFGNNKFEGKRLTTAMIAGTLERFLDRPIVDMTDLKGAYDVTLDVTQEDYRAMLIHAAVAAGVSLPPEALRLLDGASLPSLFEAVQKAGLKLDARKAPLDVIIVDEGRKTPTEN
ncbi:MAG: TIGR03435 family protein [Acidobacteriia bacterium]|nr:TIGR03435 family protein [Terriglobia bacterium]